jgi:hypothetical protein
MKAPLISHPKIQNWPPPMGGAYGRGTIFPNPGEGALVEVIPVPVDQDRPACLTLVVDHLGNRFSGELFAADPGDTKTIDLLGAELRKRVGKSLHDIGMVEVDL